MHEARHDLPTDARRKLIEILDQSLCDAVDLRTQLKLAHWNVRGPHFIPLHELFDSIAAIVAGFSDELAERAAALGGVVTGAARDAASKSRLDAYPHDITTGPDHTKAVADRIAAFNALCRKNIEIASDLGDAGTEDLYTEIIRELDKQLWFVEAHLQADK